MKGIEVKEGMSILMPFMHEPEKVWKVVKVADGMAKVFSEGETTHWFLDDLDGTEEATT